MGGGGRSTCREAASGNGHEHVIEWIDQQEKEEEDALVRRREELALSFANTWAKGKELGARLVREAEEERYSKAEGERLVREAKERAILESDRTLREARLSFGQELRSVCAKLEAKNEKLLGRLPPEIWQKILDDYLHQNDMLALGMTCRFFRDTTKDLGKKMETNLKLESGKMKSHSLGWFRWACDTFEILPGFQHGVRERVEGAVYEGDLVNYAALQGSVEILRWLMEEKGCELNKNTDWSAGKGGSIEVFEYLLERGYEFDRKACEGAARGGCLKALKFLRSQDPPCPWNAETCGWAADGGHLEVLKWLRAQNPPCPWNWETCWRAAEEGHLDVLKWMRAQEPPCPWSASTCSLAARIGQLEALKWLRAQNPPCPWSRSACRLEAWKHQHVIDWIDQQEAESDVSDIDSDGSYNSDSYDIGY